MKDFFKTMAASAVGQLITGIILAFVFAIFLVARLLSGLGDMGEKMNVEIKEKSVLHLKFESPITDLEQNPEFNFDLSGFSADKVTGLNVILRSIDRAAKDEFIKGIFLDVSAIDAGMASIEEIRNKLIDFKKSGKFIVAFSEMYTHKSYYLASVADNILLYPEGLVQHTGLTANIMFMKGLIDKMELDLTIIRGTNNKFKSAVEPYMLEKMSDANRQQTEKYLFSLWNHMLAGIGKSRKIEVTTLNQLADSLTLRNAEAALEHKLVDQIAYRDEAFALLRKKLDIKETDELNLVGLGDYNKDKRLGKEKKEKEEDNRPSIAVIYAVGDIIDGKGDRNSIGGSSLSEEIRNARLDSTIKAVVLRVNSPGGSALASDVIWREVVLTKKVKPVVVSMGDLAASGGYYISCAADKIFAQPNTITGSIGVFGILPNTERMLKSKLGVTYDRVRTNAHSDLGSMSRPLDDMEFKVIQQGVDEIYSDFTYKVAEGRKHKSLTQSMVDSMGQGRVWSGEDALKLGLVDEIGGLQDAIREAAKRANLSEDGYQVIDLPKVKDPFQQFIEELSGETKIEFITKNFGLSPEMMLYLYDMKKMLSQKGVKAVMPYYLEIQ
jgi:protease-4